MHTYLEQTKFAAERIIDTLTSDFHELNRQILTYQKAGDWMTKWNNESREKGLLATALDKENFPQQLNMMSEMFTQARIASHKANDLSAELKAREFATQVLAGAILQIGKQAISVAHGSHDACPNGRMIGTQSIKHIIWQGRNQAIHFEDGNPHSPVIACFETLDNDLKTDLAPKLSQKVNLATHVIDILRWHSYAAYEADMVSLVG